METETQGFANFPRPLNGGAGISRWLSQDQSPVKTDGFFPRMCYWPIRSLTLWEGIISSAGRGYGE